MAHVFVEGDDGLCVECGLAWVAPGHVPDTLPPEAHARSTDPWTSHAAAASLSEDALRQSQQDVLRVLAEIGPATDTTLVAEYRRAYAEGRISYQSDSGIRTRRNELTENGLVEDTGMTERLPISGRLAKVWRARVTAAASTEGNE